MNFYPSRSDSSPGQLRVDRVFGAKDAVNSDEKSRGDESNEDEELDLGKRFNEGRGKRGES